jgi:hypothetical protein
MMVGTVCVLYMYAIQMLIFSVSAFEVLHITFFSYLTCTVKNVASFINSFCVENVGQVEKILIPVLKTIPNSCLKLKKSFFHMPTIYYYTVSMFCFIKVSTSDIKFPYVKCFMGNCVFKHPVASHIKTFMYNTVHQ